MVSPSKIARSSLPPLVRRKILGRRPGRAPGLEPLDGARRQHQHAMGRLAAQHLLPGEGDDIELGEVEPLGKGGGGGVAEW